MLQVYITELVILVAGVTAVEPGWLAEVGGPLCTWSGPLPDPPPGYQAGSDAVQCWQHVSFGSHSWPLPIMLTDIKDGATRTATFAVALLEGKVLPIFAGEQGSSVCSSLQSWQASVICLSQNNLDW